MIILRNVVILKICKRMCAYVCVYVCAMIRICVDISKIKLKPMASSDNVAIKNCNRISTFRYFLLQIFEKKNLILKSKTLGDQ